MATNESKSLLQLCKDKEWDYIMENLTEKISEWNTDEIDTKGNNPLHTICNAGQVEIIKKIHEKNVVYTKTRNFEGNTLLLNACSSGNLELVKWCLANGSSLDEKDDAGRTCVVHASVAKDKDVIEYLLEQGCSLKETGSNGRGCMYYAAICHLDVLKFLIEKGCSVKTVDNYGHTPLLLACSRGKLENVAFLLENGSSLDEKADSGDSAITCAAASGNLSLVKFLLEKGCSVHTTNYEGETILQLAISTKNLELVKYLVEEKGMDMNQNTDAGFSAAYYALCDSNVEIVRWMFENGADANGCVRNKSYLQYSVMLFPLEYTKILMMHGADASRKTADGKNIVHLACTCANYPCVEWLINNGHSFTENDYDGENCFFAAIAADKPDSLKTLKFLFERLTYEKSSNEAKQIINTFLTMEFGGIDLVGMAALGNLEILKYLVQEHDASLTSTYPNGQNILDLANSKGNYPVVNWLEENGFDSEDDSDSDDYY